MRLTCPNCGAQYEVPDDVIPQAGRDVQCSNCGDTWFQTHRDHPVPREDVSTAPDDQKVITSEPDEPEPTARPGRREIDPSVASVLREEAEREKRARAAAQGGGLETQPDLGLQDTHEEDRRKREARLSLLRGDVGSVPVSQAPLSKTAAPRVPEAPDPGPQGSDPTSRRALFPSIEEINSSLAPGNPEAGADPDHIAHPGTSADRAAFRGGFLVAVLIAVAALMIYVFAPQLADMLPALRDVLGDYVGWVNGLRQWLDGQIAALMLWLDGMASTAPAAPADTAPD